MASYIGGRLSCCVLSLPISYTTDALHSQGQFSALIQDSSS